MTNRRRTKAEIIAADPRLAKPGIARIIGDPPPRPDHHVERPHPQPSPKLHRQLSAERPGTAGYGRVPSHTFRYPADSPVAHMPKSLAQENSPPHSELIRIRQRTSVVLALCAPTSPSRPAPLRTCSRQQNCPVPGSHIHRRAPLSPALRSAPLPPCRQGPRCRPAALR
jgi:hypothetical protein